MRQWDADPEDELNRRRRRRGCGAHRRIPRRCRPLPGPAARLDMSASVWWQARCRYEIAWTDDLLDTLIDTAPAEASLVVGGLRDGVSFCFAVRACDHRAATEQAIVLAAQMIRAALAETCLLYTSRCV